MSSERAPFAAAALLIAATTYLTVSFGLVPLLIVGIPGVGAYALWYVAYRPAPLASTKLQPLFLATIAGFAFHSIEEYLGHYGPAVGRLFGFVWTDAAFVITVLCLLGGLGLIAIGLQRGVRLAGFVATLFLATRVAELALFVFPFIRPAIEPDAAGPISRLVNGTFVHDMPNHYIAVVHGYYFPGMFSVILPLAPAVLALHEIWRRRP